MAFIDDILQESLKALAEREPQAVARILDSYEVAINRVAADLTVVTEQILPSLERAGVAPDQWLNRQRWWGELEDSIHREMIAWSNGAASEIAALQAGGVSIATDVAQAITRAANRPFAGQVYGRAFERWVSATDPQSPLRRVFASYGAEARDVAYKRMTEGIGSGKAPRTIVREIMRDLKGEGPEARLLTMARTESMRAYRGASSDQMGALQRRGIVTGYVWLSALQPNTCLACLEHHGTFYEKYPDGWHPNCRCIARAVANPAIIPGGGWQGETGEQWLRAQPLTTQRRVMLTPGRLEMFQDGESLSAFVTVRHSDVWGPTIGIAPMRDVRERRRRNV